MPRQKKVLIEQAYTEGERLGLAVWGMDEAGPYQAIPQPGICWQPLTCPVRYPHEHLRHGTAKMLTLFHPSTGTVRVKGVRNCPNAVLHACLQHPCCRRPTTAPVGNFGKPDSRSSRR